LREYPNAENPVNARPDAVFGFSGGCLDQPKVAEKS
jgi:hypothetical protein